MLARFGRMSGSFAHPVREPPPALLMPNDPNKVYSVSGITRKIGGLLEYEIGNIWVKGEISNHRAQASGHHYFTLKDASAQIQCVLFRGDAERVQALPRNGDEVQIYGELGVYQARGQYQVIVRQVQAHGAGQLQVRFDQLKARLQAEGLFEPSLRRPIPVFPRTVALITSPTGAAVRDMLQVLKRRAPWLRILVYPVAVQGDGAYHQIVAALNGINAISGVAENPQVDTIILARGGGSLEDLWNFNEEAVARAVAQSTIPVISGVGHETDTTIVDFVSDLRAPTPSAAAELVAPDHRELRDRLHRLGGLLEQRIESRLTRHQETLQRFGASTLLRDPARIVRDQEQALDHLTEQLHSRAIRAVGDREHAVERLTAKLAQHQPARILDILAERLAGIGHRLSQLPKAQLDAQEEALRSRADLLRSLGPDSVLARGFSITATADGTILRSVTDAKEGSKIVTQLADGSIVSTVSERTKRPDSWQG